MGDDNNNNNPWKPAEDVIQQNLQGMFKQAYERNKKLKAAALWRAIFSDTFWLAMVPFAYFWQGWVLTTLWGWYVTPLIQLKLSIYFAVGIMITFRMLIRQPVWGRLDALFMPLIILTVGAIWRWLGWGI